MKLLLALLLVATTAHAEVPAILFGQSNLTTPLTANQPTTVIGPLVQLQTIGGTIISLQQGATFSVNESGTVTLQIGNLRLGPSGNESLTLNLPTGPVTVAPLTALTVTAGKETTGRIYRGSLATPTRTFTTGEGFVLTTSGAHGTFTPAAAQAPSHLNLASIQPAAGPATPVATPPVPTNQTALNAAIIRNLPTTQTPAQPAMEEPQPEQPAQQPSQPQPEQPAPEQPVIEQPTPEQPTEQPPEVPTEEQPTQQPPEQQPEPEQPVIDQPTPEQPTEQPPEVPTEEQPTQQPPEQQPAPEQPVIEQPTPEQPTEQPPEVPTEEQPTQPQPDPDQPVIEQPIEQPPPEDPQPEPPTEEQPTTEQPQPDTPTPEIPTSQLRTGLYAAFSSLPEDLTQPDNSSVTPGTFRLGTFLNGTNQLEETQTSFFGLNPTRILRGSALQMDAASNGSIAGLGRWVGGQLINVSGPSSAPSVIGISNPNSTHYIWGEKPTAIPTTGRLTYNLFSATQPTYTGENAPNSSGATFTGNLAIDFSPGTSGAVGTYHFNGAVTMPQITETETGPVTNNVTYNITTGAGGGVLNGNTFNNPTDLIVTAPTGALACPSGCTGSVNAAGFGAGMNTAGTLYTITPSAPQNGTTGITGAALFTANPVP